MATNNVINTGMPIEGAFGGTGVANTGKTITLGGSLSTIGAFTSAFTMTGATAVTFPTSGTLATVAGTVASVTGTANRITIGGTSTNPTVDIAATYVGQNSITTLGTIATGVWNGTGITVPYGGTGNSTFTAYSVICAGTTATGNFQNVSGVGSSGQVLTSNGAGALPTWQAAAAGTVTSVSGTAGRITSTGGATPVIDIDATYVGQNSITTLGTVTTGVWNGTAVTVPYGGTGNTTFTAYSVICAGTTATGTFQNVSGLGSTGEVLTSNGAAALPTWQAVPGGASAATQADQETGTATNVYVSPGRQQYHPSAPKFWVRYTSVTTTAITSSYNVTSLTDNGTGDTTITLTTAFSNTNYNIVASCSTDDLRFVVSEIFTINNAGSPLTSAPSTSACRVSTGTPAVGFADTAYNCVIGTGDQ